MLYFAGHTGVVELRNNLQDMLGVKLPATLIFDHPTIHALVAFLVQEQATTARQTSETHMARTDRTIGELQDIAARLLGHVVPADAPLMEVGLDSLGN